MTRYEYSSTVEYSSFAGDYNYGRPPAPVKSLRREIENKGPKVRRSPKVWADRLRRLDALRDLITKNIETAHRRQAEYYNKGRCDVRFQLGDLVMCKAHVLSSEARKFSAKLAPDWEGPFVIIEDKPPNVYMLKMGDGRKNPKVHVSELKKYREGRGREGKGVGGGSTN